MRLISENPAIRRIVLRKRGEPEAGNDPETAPVEREESVEFSGDTGRSRYEVKEEVGQHLVETRDGIREAEGSDDVAAWAGEDQQEEPDDEEGA